MENGCDDNGHTFPRNSSDVTSWKDKTDLTEHASLASILTKEQMKTSELSMKTTSENGLENDASSIALQRLPSADINRRCWICYACEEDEDAPVDELVNPCGCKGSTKWVHQICINQWIDEVQSGNATKEIRCPYCRTNFAFEFPTPSFFFRSLSQLDSCYTGFCSTIAAGNLGSMLGFTAVASNATKIFKEQIKHVIDLLKEGNDSPWKQLALGVGMQLVVPTSLIILEQHLSSLEDRLARQLDAEEGSKTDLRQTPPPPALDAEMDGVDNIHQIIAALLFPTMADSIGNVLYGSFVANSFQRYLMGGMTFIFCRGMIKVIYKRKQFSLQRKRRVKNKE